MSSSLETLFSEIRACKVCEHGTNPLPHTAHPVVRGTSKARIRLIGQAPGTRVHVSGIPFDDPSGDRLRDWMGVDRKTFYDEDVLAITPMGFCFPGLDKNGSDLPPRKECAPLWQSRITPLLPKIEFTLLVGGYAQKYYLGDKMERNLTETVRHWRKYTPHILPLPHPSWRNNIWIKKNAWFEETLVYLKKRVKMLNI